MYETNRFSFLNYLYILDVLEAGRRNINTNTILIKNNLETDNFSNVHIAFFYQCNFSNKISMLLQSIFFFQVSS